MATINNKDIKSRLEEYHSKTLALRCDIVSDIVTMIKEMGGTINLTTKRYDDGLYIAYDGGNHVEYASSMCEEVKQIKTFKDDNEFYVEVENEDRVASYRLIFDDVCDIWEIVSSRYNDFNENIDNYKEIVKFATKNGLKSQMDLTYNDLLDIDKLFGEPIDLETLENPSCVEVKGYLYVDVLGLKDVSDLRDNDLEFCRYQNIVASFMKINKPQYIIGAEDGIVQGLLWCRF